MTRCARMRRVDLDDINFDLGSWELDEEAYRKLERLARAIQRVLDERTEGLIEGGSRLAEHKVFVGSRPTSRFGLLSRSDLRPDFRVFPPL